MNYKNYTVCFDIFIYSNHVFKIFTWFCYLYIFNFAFKLKFSYSLTNQTHFICKHESFPIALHRFHESSYSCIISHFLFTLSLNKVLPSSSGKYAYWCTVIAESLIVNAIRKLVRVRTKQFIYFLAKTISYVHQ